MEHKNMSLWNKVEKTLPSETKKVSLGKRVFTAIDPTAQIKHATMEFGPFGLDWWIEGEDYRVVEVSDKLQIIMYTGTLVYHLDGTQGKVALTSAAKLVSEGKYGVQVDTDATKKAQTDALTKGLSRLGFNADVFLGMFDDNKYVADMKKMEKETKSSGMPLGGVQPNQPRAESKPKDGVPLYNPADLYKKRKKAFVDKFGEPTTKLLISQTLEGKTVSREEGYKLIMKAFDDYAASVEYDYETEQAFLNAIDEKD